MINWEKNFLALEGSVAVLLSIVSTLIYIFYDECARQYANKLLIKNSLLSILISAFSSLLGFIITATSIVISFSQSDRFQRLRKSSHYSTVWRIFKSATISCSLAVIISILLLIVGEDIRTHWASILVFSGVGFWFFFRFGRLVWAYKKIIDIMTIEPE